MQVFGLPNQFASAEKTAAHWSQKICCKCPRRPDLDPAQDLFKKAYDPCAAKERVACRPEDPAKQAEMDSLTGTLSTEEPRTSRAPSSFLRQSVPVRKPFSAPSPEYVVGL